MCRLLTCWLNYTNELFQLNIAIISKLRVSRGYVIILTRLILVLPLNVLEIIVLVLVKGRYAHSPTGRVRRLNAGTECPTG